MVVGDGTQGFTDNTVPGSLLDVISLFHGTTLPTAGTNKIPQYGLFLKTDTGLIYENTGSLATPVWTLRVLAGGDLLPYLKISTTIGDYSQPASAVASSENITSPTFSDDFTADTNWTPSGSGQAYDAGNDEWDFTSPNTNGAMYCYRDLTGAEISGDFYFQCKIRFDALAAADGCGVDSHFIGLSDITTTQGTNVSQDAIGIFFWNNDVILVNANNAAPNAVSPSNNVLTTGTFYFRMYRNGTTVYVDIADNINFSSPIYSANATVAGTGLRYMHLYSHHTNSGACGAGTTTYSIDDVIFVNGTYVYNYFPASNSVDNQTATKWKSNSEANPRIYVDLTSNREIVGLALNIDKTTTTVTSLKIRASTDTTFTDGENIVYINLTDFTDDTWRFLVNNFLSDNRRYVQIYANETGVLAINEIKVRYGVSDLLKILDHRHKTRIVDSADSFVDSN